MMGTGATFDGIACFSPDPWVDVKRPRQLMQCLSEHLPVVYVEAPVTVASLIKNPRQVLADRGERWRRALLGSVEEVGPGIHVVTPMALLPEHRLSQRLPALLRDALRKSARWGRGRLARVAADRLGIQAPIVWLAEPVDPAELGFPDGTFVVYDCLDCWSDFPAAVQNPVWQQRIADEERALFAAANVTFCSAKGLLGHAREEGCRSPVLLQNAADVKHFRLAEAADIVPPEVAGLPQPVVGYIGAIADWVDLELVRDVAELRPEWSFVLVGPVFSGSISGDVSSLERVAAVPNVHLVGPRPYAEMPSFLTSFDVGIIPFKLNALTENTDPIKVYEYLAAGIPVVSTPLPQVEGLTGVRTAANAVSFAAQLDHALVDGQDLEFKSNLRQTAEQNSWDARSDVVLGSLRDASARDARADEDGRPRVLVIATDLPWPMNSGWRIRAFENIRAISEFADVTLISFAEPVDVPPDVAGLRSALPSVRVLDPVPIPIHIKERPLLLARAALGGLLTGQPYKIAKFSSAEMRRRLLALCAEESFDFIHVEMATSIYGEMLRREYGSGSAAIVMDEHNVESRLLHDHWLTGEFGALGPIVRIEAARTRRFETTACARADLVLTISEEDRLELVEMTDGSANIITVPPVLGGVALSARRRPNAGGTVLFVGQLSWLPNQEAVRWFCSEVLPVVRSRLADVRVDVVGGGAPAELADLMRANGVEPLGYVDDLGAVYDRAAVFVAPFLTGGGVRLKLLEAMRESVPIVSTTAGVKGLAVRSGVEVLTADSAEEFADCVVAAISDAVLAERLTAAATEYLSQHHSRESASAIIRQAYEAVGRDDLARPSSMLPQQRLAGDEVAGRK